MMVMVKVMATKEMIKCFTFGKEEREIKMGSRQRYNDRSHFLFVLKTPYRV
jgi:hypothetical protein